MAGVKLTKAQLTYLAKLSEGIEDPPHKVTLSRWFAQSHFIEAYKESVKDSCGARHPILNEIARSHLASASRIVDDMSSDIEDQARAKLHIQVMDACLRFPYNDEADIEAIFAGPSVER